MFNVKHGLALCDVSGASIRVPPCRTAACIAHNVVNNTYAHRDSVRNKRRPTYFSDLKEFFDRSQFFCARPSCSGKPHAEDPARRSNVRCDFIEAEIRVFDELSESRDQHPFSGRFSFLESFFKSHKSVSSERAVA